MNRPYSRQLYCKQSMGRWWLCVCVALVSWFNGALKRQRLVWFCYENRHDVMNHKHTTDWQLNKRIERTKKPIRINKAGHRVVNVERDKSYWLALRLLDTSITHSFTKFNRLRRFVVVFFSYVRPLNIRLSPRCLSFAKFTTRRLYMHTNSPVIQYGCAIVRHRRLTQREVVVFQSVIFCCNYFCLFWRATLAVFRLRHSCCRQFEERRRCRQACSINFIVP